MKIIYCLAGTYNPGGMERIVISKANWLAKQGHEVIIVTTEQRGRRNFFELDNSIKCYDLGINYSDNDGVSTLRRFFSRWRKMKFHKRELCALLKELKPDITISTFGNEIEFLYSIPYAGKKLAEIHFSRWFRLQMNKSGLHGIANKILTNKDYNTVKKYDAFVCLTNEDKENWGSLQNIHVIPNFIQFTNNEPAKLNSHRAIAVGRLTFQKGYDRMIKAWEIVHKKHPDWCLDIYGSGELKEELISLINKLYLKDSIIIHDPVSDITTKMAENSMLVLSSHFEGLPMVLLEAMACGLPVVSYDFQCGPKDIITPETGIIVHEGNIEQLVEAICRLIESPDIRKEMGGNAFINSKRYSPDYIMPIWENIFNELLYK